MNDNAELIEEERPVPVAAVEETLDRDRPETSADRTVGSWPYLAQPGIPVTDGEPAAIAVGQDSATAPDLV